MTNMEKMAAAVKEHKMYQASNQKYYDIFFHMNVPQVNAMMAKPITLHESTDVVTLMNCGISKRLAYDILKHYPDSFDAAGLLDKRKQSFYFYGDTGTGKTFYAIALALANMGSKKIHPNVIVFVTMEQLLSNLRFAMNRPNHDQSWRDNYNTASLSYNGEDCTVKYATEEEYLHMRYKNAPTLIIDDYGVEKMTDWSKQIFDAIINHRYMNFYPTIITSNINPLSSEKDTYLERLISRYTQMNGFLKFTEQLRYQK